MTTTTTAQSSHSRTVQTMFNTITNRYDFLNTLLSCGIDRLWRRRMIRAMRFFNTNRYLDLATGTGDIALRVVKHYPGVSVLATDFAQEMLDVAHHKIELKHAQNRITVQWGDALNLNVADNAFDSTGMAFGIRNITDKLQVLKEMKRVTVPGGRIVILELTQPENVLLKPLYRHYLRTVMPRIARLFTSEAQAYHYLADSILNFPDPKTFLALMTKAGISDVSAIPLSFGTCHLFSGTIEDQP